MSISKTKFLVFFCIVLLFSNIYVWQRVESASDETLVVNFLDVGQGDSILIESPNGVQMLIDGGRDGQVLRELQNTMPIGDQILEVVLATHPDADHIGGLDDVLAKFEVKQIIGNGDTSDTATYRSYVNAGESETGAEVLKLGRGERIVLDQNRKIYLDVLAPEKRKMSDDTNSNSIVARLTYGEVEFLLTGDADTVTESEILKWCRECLQSDVLKAGHHGSRTSTSRTFLESVSPIYAVISAGRKNSYGHPHKEVIQTLQNAGVQILETSKEGTITFETDGVGLWLR